MWRQENLSTQVCACGMNYKKGTSVFAVVFGILSLILVIILGVALSEIIQQEEYLVKLSYLYKSKIELLKIVYAISIVLYGLHALSCGLVIVSAKTGNRFFTIPWMVFGCIMGGLQLRAIWLVITGGFSSSGSSNFGNNPMLTLVFGIVFLLLLIGFGFCVGKLFRILRAESAERNLPGGQIPQAGFVVSYQPTPQQAGNQPPLQQMPPEVYQPQQYPVGGFQMPPQQIPPPVYQLPPNQQYFVGYPPATKQ